MKNQKRLAKYKMIENDILSKINSGFYTKGQFIPTEQELVKEYNVSRVTVRQATNNLVAKGYLIRNQGSGTFVAEPSYIGRTTNIKSFTDEMSALGKKVSSNVLAFKIIPASEFVSQKLNISPESPVYYIERLRKADEEPMMHETTYMSVADFPDLSYEKLLDSRYKFVEQTKNVSIDYSHQVVVPMMPTDEIVTYFQCDPEQPILKVLNTTYLATGEVSDYSVLMLNTAKYQYQAIKVK
ncbi:GntR family transcriptional regulator, glv operon transcriptional regulator/GntR family transcriptional regulator, mannosyl-D-glycerate transport/metabolism system repressor [Evansella caseinilytica]|uniref:GntR family transcriptional regulator, glv operon transcriptional regulator/GntR family transcriptional regulator, mannosyl-D-glycerate transport/metabolism system repressor n=1 Tax=Evansella caseinilytica TaxID=1503961 RepID=A0A1H3UTW0_9BACI|nr:GntR family transcriptional regulator [Evansella caseinilytica]SDZ65768.1 GntR family transcriptional regulator, glv operon transcriptional regulator/GntR family transcriptional regulator, mannosyl-D-glycerate transport/metabolism system repressor [Evansella caseinilytica]